jgi:3-deoxy-D-arabino-heptulosonate 7-phosphate (DAHP) synthase
MHIKWHVNNEEEVRSTAQPVRKQLDMTVFALGSHNGSTSCFDFVEHKKEQTTKPTTISTTP